MPAVGIDQTVDHLESGGFAAAAGADKNDKFTFFDLKIEVIEDYIVAILFGYMFKPNHWVTPFFVKIAGIKLIHLSIFINLL